MLKMFRLQLGETVAACSEQSSAMAQNLHTLISRFKVEE